MSSSDPRACPRAAPGPALTPPPAVLPVLPESFEWSVGDGALLEVGEPSEATVVPGDPSATIHNIQYGFKGTLIIKGFVKIGLKPTSRLDGLIQYRI